MQGNNSKKDISSILQNFPISNEDALKCVKMRCYYKAAKRFPNNDRATILGRPCCALVANSSLNYFALCLVQLRNIQ